MVGFVVVVWESPLSVVPANAGIQILGPHFQDLEVLNQIVEIMKFHVFFIIFS